MQNTHFLRAIARLRKHLPAIAFSLLTVTYAIAALVGGLLLSQHLGQFGPLGVALAYGIGVAIQAVRGTIVFFGQLNPDRPTLSSWAGKTTAIILGGLSIIEVYKLSGSLGIDEAVVISLGLLMAAGVVIELFILHEVQTASNLEFFSDATKRKNLIEAMKAKKDFEVFLSQLDEIEGKPSAPTLPARAKGNGATYPAAIDLEALLTGSNGNGKH